MTAKVKFGECLRLLLTSLDISSNRLSQAIKVDGSLISRWIHERRVPSYHSNYIENIAQYLACHVLNSFQAERLNEAIFQICGATEGITKLEDKIKKALLEAQGYSMEQIKKGKKEISSRPKGWRKGYIPLNSSIMAPNAAVSLSHEDKVIVGNISILSQSLALVKKAAKERSQSENCTIYLTFNHETSILSFHPDFFSRLQLLLLKALKNGWKVLLLLRLTTSVNRLIDMISFSQPLIEAGSFQIYYYRHYHISLPDQESIVIPGIGAMSAFSTQPLSGIDCAFYWQNPTAVLALSNYFTTLVATAAHPLMTYQDPERSREYSQIMLLSEGYSGKRYFYKDELSHFTQPGTLYKKMLKKNFLPIN